MDFDNVYNKAVRVMEKLKPFIAIFVLVFIVLSAHGLYKYNKLQEDVKESCGYNLSEKVYCVCDKSFVSQIDVRGNPYYVDYFNESSNFSISEIRN